MYCIFMLDTHGSTITRNNKIMILALNTFWHKYLNKEKCHSYTQIKIFNNQ